MTPTELEKLKQAQHQPDLSGLAVSGLGFAHGKNMTLLDDVVLDDAGNPVIHSKDQLEFALDHKFGKFVTRGEANDVMWAFFNDERVQKNATTTYNAQLGMAAMTLNTAALEKVVKLLRCSSKLADCSLNLFGRPKIFGLNLSQMA
jgi:hypothetical protein